MNLPILFPGENGVEVFSGHSGCIHEDFVVSSEFWKVDFLLEDKFVEFGVQMAVGTFDEVVQVLADFGVEGLVGVVFFSESVEEV